MSLAKIEDTGGVLNYDVFPVLPVAQCVPINRGMLGNTVGGWGICHSFCRGRRCISLLKIMLTNYCIYDCAYCVNRRSNDLPRATFSVSGTGRADWVEPSPIISKAFPQFRRCPDPRTTWNARAKLAKDLRLVHRFNGYIHLKSIPGASRRLVQASGNRLGAVEIPKRRKPETACGEGS